MTRYQLSAIAVILVVFGLYLHSIQNTHMIEDEYLVFKFTRDSLGETINYLANRDVHPPLWFSFFWLWRRITGDSDFSGRLQAILFSLVTLSIVYQIGKRWFRQAHYGLFAMIILATSSLFFIYALQIRPYGLAMLLVSFCMLAFQRWLTLQTKRSVVIYALSVAALLYIHYFLFLFIMIQIIYLLVFTHHTRRLWQQAIGIAALIFIFWLPWFPNFLNQFQNIRTIELESGLSRALAGSSATTQPTSLETVIAFIQTATNGLPWLYIPALGLGLYYGWQKKNYRLALIWALGLPTLTFIINLALAVYTPRYIVNFIIGLALVIAMAIGALPSYLRWLGIVGFVIINLWGLPSQLPNDIIPYRVLLKELVRAYQPGDSILVDPPSSRSVVFNWQTEKLFPLEMSYSVVPTVEDALSARRVWYLTGDWFNEEVRTHFQEIERTHPLQEVLGKCDIQWCYLIQLMEASPWNQPVIFGEDMAFWGIDVDEITTSAIVTRLWWRFDTAPIVDYSIGLHLLDQNGKLAVQVDGPINHYDAQNINTSKVQPGQIYIDFRTLEFPPDLSPGTYDLALVVYNWQTGERLLLPDGSDHLLLTPIVRK